MTIELLLLFGAALWVSYAYGANDRLKGIATLLGSGTTRRRHSAPTLAGKDAAKSHQGMYALANAHKDKVKLMFFHGAELHDPKRLLNAGKGGNKWRAIDFREGDKLDKAALQALLREAVAYNNEHSVPKSKGSRA
jgi:uncharacterized protein DUF1801